MLLSVNSRRVETIFARPYTVILLRWTKHVQALLNGRFHRIDADPTVEELVQATKKMANGKAVGLDDLTVELLKRTTCGNREIFVCASSHHFGRMDGAERTADLEGCGDPSSAQEERPERLRPLPGALACSTCR